MGDTTQLDNDVLGGHVVAQVATKDAHGTLGCQATTVGGKAIRQGVAVLGQGRAPRLVPNDLGVEHQAVHVEDGTLDHALLPHSLGARPTL